MAKITVNEAEITLLRQSFYKEERDGGLCYVYYNDERYYIVLSACEAMQLHFNAKSNCIIVEAKEFEKKVLDIKDVVEDEVQTLQSVTLQMQPVSEATPPTLAPETLEASITEPIQEHLNISLEEQLQETQARAKQGNEETMDSRAKSLRLREEALRAREEAVSKREMAIRSTEEKLDAVKNDLQKRRHQLESQTKSVDSLEDNLSRRRQYLQQQREHIAYLKNHIQNVLDTDFYPAG